MVPFESLGTVSYSPSIVTMAVSAAILEIFSVKEWPDLEIWVWCPSRSLRMASFDRPRMTLLVSHCNYSFVPFASYLTFNNMVTLKYGLAHSRSLKLVPFKSLGAVSYLPSIVTMAVSLAISEIFSVKEWPDLEM